jgi:transposase
LRTFDRVGHALKRYVLEVEAAPVWWSPLGRREEKGASLGAAERDELAGLRRENKQLRLERDILSRAAAWFARETGTIPSGSTNS